MNGERWLCTVSYDWEREYYATWGRMPRISAGEHVVADFSMGDTDGVRCTQGHLRDSIPARFLRKIGLMGSDGRVRITE